MAAPLLADVIFRSPTDPWSWSGGTRLYLLLLAALLAERLVELRLSRRNAAAAFARGGVEVGQRHFRAMTALHSLWFAACAAEALVTQERGPLWLGAAGLAAALGAQALRWWAIGALGDRWNVRVIAVPGDPPVVAGPYRFVRHPNYLAVVIELACVPLVHFAWRTALAFSVANAVLLAVRIRAEERALGPLYASAFARTPRFLPGAGGRDG